MPNFTSSFLNAVLYTSSSVNRRVRRFRRPRDARWMIPRRQDAFSSLGLKCLEGLQARLIGCVTIRQI